MEVFLMENHKNNKTNNNNKNQYMQQKDFRGLKNQILETDSETRNQQIEDILNNYSNNHNSNNKG